MFHIMSFIMYVVEYAMFGAATVVLTSLTLKPPAGYEARMVIMATSIILWPVVLVAYLVKLLAVVGLVCLWIIKEAKFGLEN